MASASSAGVEPFELTVGKQLGQRERVRVEQAAQVGRLVGGPTLAQVVVPLEHRGQALDGAARFDRRLATRLAQLVVGSAQLVGALPDVSPTQLLPAGARTVALEGILELLLALGQLVEHAVVLEAPQAARVQVRQPLLVLRPQPEVDRRRVGRPKGALERQQRAAHHAQGLLEGDPGRVEHERDAALVDAASTGAAGHLTVLVGRQQPPLDAVELLELGRRPRSGRAC